MLGWSREDEIQSTMPPPGADRELSPPLVSSHVPKLFPAHLSCGYDSVG